MNLHPVTSVLFCACLSALAAQEPATNAQPEELVQLRRQIELRALSSAQKLAEQFANALAMITKETGAAGDYDQALAAQQRRERLVALYTKSIDDTTLSNVIVLKPADARVNGAVTYDRTGNTLVGWKTVGSIGTWDVNRLTPGTYAITLTYGAADFGEAGRPNPFLAAPDLSTGGEFEFYEDSSLAGASENRRTGKIASTGGWDTWSSLTLPPIQLTGSRARFSLKITKVRGTGGVMHLKEIRLAPPDPVVAADEPGQNPDGTASPRVDEVTKLQQDHLESLRQTITPVITSYTDTLKTLADKASTSNDPGLADDFNAEARRAAMLVENPQSVLSGPARGSRPGVNADGFRELSGATYIAHRRNTGDRFKVNHEGQEFFVRLLWVTCAPAEPGAEEQLKVHADYHGISVEDALSVSQQAQAFASSFLSGKPLILLTRGLKDADDNLLVAVHPEGMGDFAGVLVDNGLAMITAPAARPGPARRNEESVLQALKERESAAKSRPIPPGAWAMRDDE